jgi:hypothetical protein
MLPKRLGMDAIAPATLFPDGCMLGRRSGICLNANLLLRLSSAGWFEGFETLRVTMTHARPETLKWSMVMRTSSRPIRVT